MRWIMKLLLRYRVAKLTKLVSATLATRNAAYGSARSLRYSLCSASNDVSIGTLNRVCGEIKRLDRIVNQHNELLGKYRKELKAAIALQSA